METHAQGAQLGHFFDGVFYLLQHHAFGQLQLQALRGRTAGGDGLADLLHKVRLANCLALDIDGEC